MRLLKQGGGSGSDDAQNSGRNSPVVDGTDLKRHQQRVLPKKKKAKSEREVWNGSGNAPPLITETLAEPTAAPSGTDSAKPKPWNPLAPPQVQDDQLSDAGSSIDGNAADNPEKKKGKNRKKMAVKEGEEVVVENKELKDRRYRATRKTRSKQATLYDIIGAEGRKKDPFSMTMDDEAANRLLSWLLQFCILTDAKKEALKKVFVYFDADHDYRLTIEEAWSHKGLLDVMLMLLFFCSSPKHWR